MAIKPDSVSTLKSLYEQILDIEMRFNKLLAREPEFQEAEKEAKTLDQISQQIKQS